MATLSILVDFFNLLEDPAWLMFGLAGGIGLLGLLALVFLYPMSRD